MRTSELDRRRPGLQVSAPYHLTNWATLAHNAGFVPLRNADHAEIEGAYESGTEIFFNCIPNAAGDRQTWRIICDNGQWIGRSYNCGKSDPALIPL